MSHLGKERIQGLMVALLGSRKGLGNQIRNRDLISQTEMGITKSENVIMFMGYSCFWQGTKAAKSYFPWNG